MSSRIISLLTAALACVALAACGSGNNSTTTTPLTAQQYKQFLQQLSQREDQPHKALAQNLHPKSVAQLQQALNTFVADQEAVATQLSNVAPPENAKAANDQLEKAFRDIAAATRAVLPQIASAGSPQAAIAVIQKDKALQQAGQEVDAALAQLKKLGYTQGS